MLLFVLEKLWAGKVSIAEAKALLIAVKRPSLEAEILVTCVKLQMLEAKLLLIRQNAVSFNRRSWNAVDCFQKFRWKLKYFYFV